MQPACNQHSPPLLVLQAWAETSIAQDAPTTEDDDDSEPEYGNRTFASLFVSDDGAETMVEVVEESLKVSSSKPIHMHT
jgi:hypothetical protein